MNITDEILHWDKRYKEEEFAYGKDPNVFFKEQISSLIPGTIVLPADGEGRNGVYAAELGWEVTSIDQSTEAKYKAELLATERGVTLDYIVDNLEYITLEENSFDAIALIYAHFPADIKLIAHQKISQWLKPGGLIVFEAFSKSHKKLVDANPKVGGPKNIDMLFSIEEIKEYFPNYEIEILEEKIIPLQEGVYHIGTGSVIRFVGRKPAIEKLV